MASIDPKETPVVKIQQLLLGGIAPRPIALVSTISSDGIPNLSPFSWFNCFGANPPMIAFSPSRRVRDGSLKDTFHNLVATGECVVQSVTHAMVQQVSLASTEYPPDVDEFIKSGLGKLPAIRVKPFRVAESPFQMECTLRQMIPLGDGPGSGNLAVCEVVLFHVADDLIAEGVIHPDAIDLVARNSADFYTRASGAAVFEIAKPLVTRGIGIDLLPSGIVASQFLSANHLAQLANSEQIPDRGAVDALLKTLTPKPYHRDKFERAERRGKFRDMLEQLLLLTAAERLSARALFDRTAISALDRNDVPFAFTTLMYALDNHR